MVNVDLATVAFRSAKDAPLQQNQPLVASRLTVQLTFDGLLSFVPDAFE